MLPRPEDLRKRLMVKFEDEDALNYGGVSREPRVVLYYMFNPNYGPVEYSSHDNNRVIALPYSAIGFSMLYLC